MWLPDEAVWLTVRNVLAADGHPVPGSQSRLNDALRDVGAERLPRLRGLIDYSARFNLGQTFRNFNYPMQALSYLDPVLQPRFAFILRGRERVNGVDTWKIKYEELQLDMWVPVRMHETYLEMRGSTVTHSIGCEATHSNFLRFETSGRMLVPK